MRFHARFESWTALILATLGAASLVDCGGRAIDDANDQGSGGGSSDAGADVSAGGSGGRGGSGTGGSIVIPPIPPTEGRPFLVDGAARQAPACLNQDWLDSSGPLHLEERNAALRLRLSQAWTRTALLEHASIAAFARFTLQLLALGAPASLIESANTATAEETTHARLAFAVASAYAGRAIGPGPLAIEGALASTSLRDVVLSTVREGCVGETVSAIRAAEIAAYVTDAALRQVLTTIADDETRHAQLAWTFVRWALEQGDEELRRAARAEFTRSAAEVDGASSRPLGAEEIELLAGGAMPEQLGQGIHAECVRRVILPCAEALFAIGALPERRNHRAVVPSTA